MTMVRVLIGSRYGPDVEVLLNNAPSEAEVTFLPDGEKTGRPPYRY